MYLVLILIIVWLLYERREHWKMFHGAGSQDSDRDAGLEQDGSDSKQEMSVENESPIEVPGPPAEGRHIENKTIIVVAVVLILIAAYIGILALVFYPTWLIG